MHPLIARHDWWQVLDKCQDLAAIMTSELDGLGVRPDSTAISGNTADTLEHIRIG